MKTIAYVGMTDMLRRSVSIYLGEEYGDGRVGRYDSEGRLESIADESTVLLPTMVLRQDVALAMLGALQRYFDGGEETARLRKDYDAERGRVDKLTDAVIDLAKRGPVFVDERR